MNDDGDREYVHQPMQAQARICPTCHDDHWGECSQKQLVDEIQQQRQRIAELEAARETAERERDELKGWKTKAAARLVSMICALESIEEDAGSLDIAPIARGCGILKDAIDAAREGE